MSSNESVQFYIRLIQEKQRVLENNAANLLNSLVSESLEDKKNSAENMFQSTTDIMGLVSSRDVPNWLSELSSYLTAYCQDQWSASQFMQKYIELLPRLRGFQWVFSNESETAFDFDGIFDLYKKQSRLPELFSEIIRILDEIKDSGDVDSQSMLNALGKLIATIKQGKDGSYFALNAAWQFLVGFLENYMWGELFKIPVLGTAMEALKKTIDETNAEMHKLHSQVQEGMSNAVESEIKSLKNKAKFQLISYEKSGLILDAPSVNAILEKV